MPLPMRYLITTFQQNFIKVTLIDSIFVISKECEKSLTPNYQIVTVPEDFSLWSK